MARPLEFEKSIFELESKIVELRGLSEGGPVNLKKEINELQENLNEMRKHTYSNLSPWQKVQIARHPDRPYTLDYIRSIFSDFREFHGDRAYSYDKALVGGFGYLEGKPYLVIGHQKGRDAKENIFRNFGSAHPEGYRKAMRLMEIANKFHIPVISLIDTPGAYPGVGAEERGQANMIALNLREMFELTVPIIVFVIGEGGSGGALGIGIGDRIFVLENAYYSVISPEGCAAILWKDYKMAPEAAKALKLTAPELLKLGVIDGMITESLGGAHNDIEFTANEIKKAILNSTQELSKVSPEKLKIERYEKYRKMGEVLGE